MVIMMSRSPTEFWNPFINDHIGSRTRVEYSGDDHKMSEIGDMMNAEEVTCIAGWP